MLVQKAELSSREEGSRLAREELGRQAEQFHTQLSAAIESIRRLPSFGDFLKQAEFVDIAEAVATDAPLVYLVTTSAGSLALILFRASPSAPVVSEAVWADAFTESELERLLLELEKGGPAGGYLQGQLQNVPLLKLALDILLPILGSQLLSPVATRLAELGFQQMLLIPCGRLGLLPLHAALCGKDSNAYHLLERFAVAYAPSARALPVLSSGIPEQAKPAVLVGVGNPSPTSHRPLLFSRAELEEVARFFDAPHPLYEGEATKAALLRLLGGANYVHLSCHGAFSPDDALDSRLLLAHDEPLTLRDVLYGEARIPLRQVRLVVLSACQSAVPEFGRLRHEVISLQAGFLQAGATGVIGSLWPVEDVSTSLLMAKFYEYHLVGNVSENEPPMAPGKALACAQRWLRTVTARELRDYYWERK